MQDLKSVYERIREKKRDRREIMKAFKDELGNNPRHQQVSEQLKILKEEKKSIENQTWPAASADAQKLELLDLDIKADKELLADVATTMLANGEKVEIVDERSGERLAPQFSVDFKKDEDGPRRPDEEQ